MLMEFVWGAYKNKGEGVPGKSMRSVTDCEIDLEGEIISGKIRSKVAEFQTPYVLVLTHDIDVLSVKELPLSGRTFWGFAYRCLIINSRRLLSQRLSVHEYLDSLKQVLFLPLIKLGLTEDPWQKSLETMLEIEKRYGVRSTIFFIPFPNRPGHTPEVKPAPTNRAAHYKLEKYKDLLQQLEREGWEVGVHGVDAYLDLASAKTELGAFRKLLPEKDKIGIRMHWLYHKGKETWKILDEAGYAYDATFGWNDRVGFPEEQYKPFKPDGVENLVVLPLNIQDGALLGESHQFLRDEEAWHQVEHILEEAKERRATVTILWHNNSFVAPRYWGWLYEKIIQKAKEDGALICRAIDVVEMFNKGEL